MILKPDGGELYVISPESHGLQVINTETHEVGDFVVLGDTPTRGVLSVDAGLLYVTDATANRVTALDINTRRLVRTVSGRSDSPAFTELLIPVGQVPDAIRFDPEENLLLVLNKGSNDLSVIRARLDDQSLLTMIPTGDHPQELAVKLF
jgi:YVTN family beta-propeller protein